MTVSRIRKERLIMYIVKIEYTNGTSDVFEIPEKLWRKYVMPALENDDEVLCYTSYRKRREI